MLINQLLNILGFLCLGYSVVTSNKNNYVLLRDFKKRLEYGGEKYKTVVSLCIAYAVSAMCLCFSTVETEV